MAVASEEEDFPDLLLLPANLVLYFKSFCKIFTNLFENLARLSWDKMYFGFKNT